MYKNTNCFHLAIPCGDLEKAKKFYSETLGCRLDNAGSGMGRCRFLGK
jgi:extradiol dioxygenase family protein